MQQTWSIAGHINQTVMPGNVVYSQYVFQAKSLQEQLFK